MTDPTVDVNAFVGDYPFRRVAGTDPASLIRAMDRVGIDEAWISLLPAIFWRDPMEGNPILVAAAERAPRLRPVAAVHPGLPGWEEEARRSADRGAVAVRADPTRYGLEPGGAAMRALAVACGDLGVPLLLAVRLEDGRQRHPLDSAPELPAAAVRALVRASGRVRLMVTHADRAFIEEVHWGSTADERARIWWDVCWVWGPPEDHLGTLLQTIGPDRFVLGTGQPLRLPEAAVAKLDLTDLSKAAREAVTRGNVRAALGQRGDR